MKVLRVILLLSGVGLSVSIALAGSNVVDVLVGGELDLDACGSWGEVTGLNPDGDNYLSVRAGPSSSYVELDRLGPGHGMFLCDESEKWIGVVYSPSGEPMCDVSSTIARRQAYRGNCLSGWVFGKYVKLIAG